MQKNWPIFLVFCSTTIIQAQNINLNKQNVCIADLFEEIEKQAQMTIGYSESVIDVNRRISINAVDKPLQKLMEDILLGTDVSFRIQGRQILIVAPPTSNQPLADQGNRKLITGIVSDENGEPIIGVNVLEKGTTNGSITKRKSF